MKITDLTKHFDKDKINTIRHNDRRETHHIAIMDNINICFVTHDSNKELVSRIYYPSNNKITDNNIAQV